MKSRLKTLVLASLAALVALPASAQVPSYQSPLLQRNTYSAVFAGLVFPQTGAGDAVCLVGSATKTVYVTDIRVSGTNATAQAAIMNVVKRTTANSGGTSTAASIAKMDSQSPAATAVLNGYTAVPTPGTGVPLHSVVIPLSPVTVGAGVGPVMGFQYNPQLNLAKPITLRGAAQSVCVNFPNALTSAAAALSVSVTWTEQ